VVRLAIHGESREEGKWLGWRYLKVVEKEGSG
jgi:hypothetical protein